MRPFIIYALITFIFALAVKALAYYHPFIPG